MFGCVLPRAPPRQHEIGLMLYKYVIFPSEYTVPVHHRSTVGNLQNWRLWLARRNEHSRRLLALFCRHLGPEDHASRRVLRNRLDGSNVLLGMNRMPIKSVIKTSITKILRALS